MKGEKESGYVGFFFQGEGGIREKHVTGVQTCARPIEGREPESHRHGRNAWRRQSQGVEHLRVVAQSP